MDTTPAAFLALINSAETLHARSHQLQHRKERCIEVLASLANIRGRAHRTQRSHETDANREAIAVEAMTLQQYELVPPRKERTAEEAAEAEKRMSEYEVTLRARLEAACQELNEIVAAGSHGNDDLVPLGYGDAGNLQILRQDHHAQLAALNAELASVNLLRDLARQAKMAACAGAAKSPAKRALINAKEPC
jgi:seryl-tRNA synthetase